MENPIKWMIWGYHYFRKHPYSICSTSIFLFFLVFHQPGFSYIDQIHMFQLTGTNMFYHGIIVLMLQKSQTTTQGFIKPLENIMG